MTSKDAHGHLSLANAKSTEEMHLATTNDQIAEWTLTISQAEEKIRKYQEGISGQRSLIADAKREQGKLRKKRLVFKRAVFALDLIEQEG